MSKRPNSYSSNEAIQDAFTTLLDNVARLLFWGGALLTLAGVALLLVTFNSAAFATAQQIPQAMSNIDIFNKVLLVGVIALFVGSTYMFWGEETLAVFQLLLAGILIFGPPFVPGMLGSPPSNQATEASLNTIRNGGIVFAVCGLGCLVADILVRARMRIREGAKSDLLKYGKGVKEEREVQNVFMGKCWQLPFCRKFVRERCPIYHSRRTCWREQVGCMCEEQVIRDAMDNKVIPKDAVQAASYIPRNNKLTTAQKQERCRSCVIYNEHQKHKYKMAIPCMVGLFVLMYVALRQPLLDATGNLILTMDKMVGNITFNASGGVGRSINQSGVPFQEIVLFCILLVLFTYCLKVVEFAIFKLKV